MPQCWKSAVTANPPRHGEGDHEAKRNGGRGPRWKRRRGGPPPPHFVRFPSPSRGGFEEAPSLRRLPELDAAHQLFRAALHRRARSADGVGEEEVADRVADRAFR